ncbi:hypothetical protein L7F22_012269 [Adiantum nelumboides]|nr:hypothetical protein [Adiantum nelumboides]
MLMRFYFFESEAVAIFLKTQFEEDMLGPHLAPVSDDAARIKMSVEESERLEELALMGGFVDTTFLHKSLNQQISQLFLSCQEAFSMPSKIVSQQLNFEGMLFLGQLQQPTTPIPISLTYYKEKGNPITQEAPCYICFLTPNKLSEEHRIVGIIRECSENISTSTGKKRSWEVVALQIGPGLSCIDLSLYKEKQLVLLGQTISSAQAWLMILPLDDLPYKQVTGAIEGADLLSLCLTNGAVAHVSLRDGRARTLSYGDVVPPLAVSASRGLACVFAGQRRALLYDLEEDEDGQDTEME